MKKEIAILGSTGSIGTTLLNIIKKDKKNFNILLLTANKNYKLLLKQAKIFNVKNLIITDKKYFEIINKKNKNKKINIFNNFEDFSLIFKKKIDYTMSSIVGLDGLDPTLKIIKYTNNIAIANKEAIICGWNLIQKELIKNNTEFVPVDSEHFSIWFALKNNFSNNVKELFLTASGGPFLNLQLSKFKGIKATDALKHPNWKMGQKITIDSATMMNKIFEVIEAKNIFNIDYKKIFILTHPKSYIHAIVKFNSGLIKIIAHDTNMSIPIFNTLYKNTKKNFKCTRLNINILNDLKLNKINILKFPLVKILKKLPKKISLFETVLVSANDELVNLFLNKNIKFTDINKIFLRIIDLKEFKKYKTKTPNKINEILKLNDYVRLKIRSKSV